ncbi:hypothetical protein BH11ARM2_BH11ARM2_11160 [soil metagenome]
MIPALFLLTLQQKSILNELIPHPTGMNGYEEFLKVIDLSKSDPRYQEALILINSRPVDGEILADRRKGVEIAQPLLRMLRAGAVKPIAYPSRSFEKDLHYSDNFSARAIGRLLLASAYVQLAEGQSSGAVTDLLVGLRYMDVQARNGRLIGALIAMAIYSQAWALLNAHFDSFAPADLAKIEAIANDLVEHPAWSEVAEKEMEFQIAMMDFTERETEKSLSESPNEPEMQAWAKLGPSGRKILFEDARRIVQSRLTDIETLGRKDEKDWISFPEEDIPELADDMMAKDPAKAIRNIAEMSSQMAGALFALERMKWRIVRLTARMRRIMAEEDRVPTAFPNDLPPNYTYDGLTGGQLVLRTTSTGFWIESPGLPQTGPVTLVSRLPKPKEESEP